MTVIIKSHGRKVYEVPIPQTGEIGFYRDYKEPLVPLDRGFGYEGVLLFNQAMDKTQCHFCGGWYQSVGGHIKEHGLTANQYKDEYGLFRSTALINEQTRLKRSGVMTLRWRQGKIAVPDHRIGSRAARLVTLNRKAPMERKNKAGTCNMQLLSWIQNHPNVSVDKAPGRIEAAVRRAFGNWNNARAMLGLKLKTYDRSTFDKVLALTAVRNFYQINQRAPVGSDAKRGLLPYTYMRYYRQFGTWSNVLREAGVPINTQALWVPRYSKGKSAHKEFFKEWKEHYLAGEPSTSIASRYGVSAGTVLHSLRGLGVKIRPPRRGHPERLTRKVAPY